MWLPGETTLSTGGGIVAADPLSLLTQRRSEGYILSRLMFDSPTDRSKNGQFSVYNPYTVYETEDDMTDLFINEEDNSSGSDNDARGYGGLAGLEELKTLLNTLEPYVKCCSRFHGAVLESSAASHEMFQKSVFYEVFCFFTRSRTSQYALEKLILGLSKRYTAWSTVSIPNMIEKYTGKQYLGIFPRGFGKTRTIKMISAVFMVSFPGVDILVLAHRKNLVSSVKDDVVAALIGSFPPSEHDHYRLERHDDSVLLVRPGGAPPSRLKYSSSSNADSLRGNDASIVFQDEFMCVPKKTFTILMAMFQRRHTKGGFLSSAAQGKNDYQVYLIKHGGKCGSTNLYWLCNFCMMPDHVQYSNTHTSCYRGYLFTPPHITYSSDNKEFEAVLTQSEVSFENELGVIRPEDLANDEEDEVPKHRSQFSRDFLRRFHNPENYVHLSSIDPHGPRDAAYWVYIDPAFHSSKQSAMAICCVRYDRHGPILVFMDRKMVHSNDLGRVGYLMGEMYVKCVETVVAQTNPNTCCNFFLAIERNINPDAARGYYMTWANQESRLPFGRAKFFFYVDVYGGKKAAAYGYLVDASKKLKCDTIISMLNNGSSMGSFRVATSTEYCAFMRDTSIVEHLLKELKNFQSDEALGCTGKLTHETTDDCCFCFIMALYLGYQYRKDALVRVNNAKNESRRNCTRPWVTPYCQCPLLM